MSNKSQPQNQVDKSSHRFRCPRCNVNFSHQKVYHEHLRSHMTSHKDDLSSQTGNISTTDEITRYIAERRKNFPTADNITKKIKSDEERQERGDVLETRQFGKMKERKPNLTKPYESELTMPIMVPTVSNTTNARATLLERLLASDIRRERNMVLQCVRHIVNNNFFGLDSN